MPNIAVFAIVLVYIVTVITGIHLINTKDIGNHRRPGIERTTGGEWKYKVKEDDN